MSRQSDPCFMGQHDRCKSPYCRCAECVCATKTEDTTSKGDAA